MQKAVTVGFLSQSDIVEQYGQIYIIQLFGEPNCFINLYMIVIVGLMLLIVLTKIIVF